MTLFSNNFFGFRGKQLNALVIGTAGIAFLLFGFGTLT
jgi:hypothetical protein